MIIKIREHKKKKKVKTLCLTEIRDTWRLENLLNKKKRKLYLFMMEKD